MPRLPLVALGRNPEKWAREASLERLETVMYALPLKDHAVAVLSRVFDERRALAHDETPRWLPYHDYPSIDTVAISDLHDQVVPRVGMIFSIGERYRCDRERYYVIKRLVFKRPRDSLPAYIVAHPLERVDVEVSHSGPIGATYHYETRPEDSHVRVEPKEVLFFRNTRIKKRDQFEETSGFEAFGWNVPIPSGTAFTAHD